MKVATLISALALAGSALAAPTRPRIQNQILALEITLQQVINDIVQSSSTLATDYASSLGQLGVLVNELQGPQVCSPFVPGRPTRKAGAIRYLQSSTTSLQNLSLDLLDPMNIVDNSDFHGDICQAAAYLSAVSQFVAKQ